MANKKDKKIASPIRTAGVSKEKVVKKDVEVNDEEEQETEDDFKENDDFSPDSFDEDFGTGEGDYNDKDSY